MSQETIKLKARIQNKYETLENWNKLTREDNFIPLKGEVCYGIDNNILYQKVGNGETNFVDLPWLLNQGDWNEPNENSPSYIKNKIGYRKFDTEKSLMYSYDVTQNEYPNFEIAGAEEGMGTIAIMTDYFDKSSNLDIDIYVDNETTPEVSLKDFNIVKSVSVEDSIFYYAGNVYPLAILLLEATEEILQEMGIEKTEDNYGFICVDEADAFGCYIWTEKVATSYYKLDMYGYNSTIIPIPQEFLDIDYDQFVGHFDEGSSYGEIFNDYTSNMAKGNYSHAEGTQTRATGQGSHAEGHGGSFGLSLSNISYNYDTISCTESQANYFKRFVGSACIIYYTSTLDSTSKKFITKLRGVVDNNNIRFNNNLPEDINTSSLIISILSESSGYYSHTEGSCTLAQGDYSHSEGSTTVSLGQSSHSEGNYSVAKGDYSHAEGNYTDAPGKSSHSEGDSTNAEGDYSHSEGQETLASNIASHAEGYQTQATGLYSHAEGNGTAAKGENTHAEGYMSTASGAAAHAEGKNTQATGKYSHAEGEGTVAPTSNVHVQGKYNAYTNINYDYAHVVGNGKDTNNRSNAHTLDWNGNAWYAGTITATDYINPNQAIPSLNTSLNGWTVHKSMHMCYFSPANSKIAGPISITNTGTTKITGNLIGKNILKNAKTQKYIKSYENGSTITFNVDGSIDIDKKLGDEIDEYRLAGTSSYISHILFTFSLNGNKSLENSNSFWTLSNTDKSCAFFVDDSLENQTITMEPEVLDIRGNTHIKSYDLKLTAGVDSEFNITIRPQLEEGQNATYYEINQHINLNNIEIGETRTIDSAQLGSDRFGFIAWYSTNNSSVSIKYFTQDNIINYQKMQENLKDKYYTLNLNPDENIKAIALNNDKDSLFTISLPIGQKVNNEWTSLIPKLPTNLFYDLDDLFAIEGYNEGALIENSGGFCLDNAKIINTSEQWSIDLSDLQVFNSITHNEYNTIKIKKSNDNEIEQYYIYFSLFTENSVELEILELLEFIATADKISFKLPNGILHIQ